MKKSDWGPGAPKVPLLSDERARDAKRAKRLERMKRKAEKFEQSKRKTRPATLEELGLMRRVGADDLTFFAEIDVNAPPIRGVDA